jgi:hypothetical protein
LLSPQKVSSPEEAVIRAVPGDRESPVYTTPTKDGKALIYLRTYPATEGQKSWLRANGFKELEISFEDLQELLRKGHA